MINKKKNLNEMFTAYSFLLPDILGLTIFVVIPILFAFYISLHEWNLLSDKVFIGFDNYIKLFSDLRWWKSVKRTLLFSAVFVPTLYTLSLFFAVLIDKLKSKYTGIIRTVFLLPFAVTSVISAVLWMFLYNPKNGIINQFLVWIGISKQQFLGSPTQALFSVIIVLLWINLGYNMIIFLSAIKEIPQQYYEAAKIDGATEWQSFKNITLPLLKDTSSFILITASVTSFTVFDQIMVMTAGGPASASEVSILYIYKQGFEFYNMGYASALAVVLFIILFIVSIIIFSLFSEKGGWIKNEKN